MIFVALIFVTGCTQQQNTTTDTTKNTENTQQNIQNTENKQTTQNQKTPENANIKDTTPIINTGDSKRGDEKIKETINAAIADGEYSKAIKYDYPKDEYKGTENLQVSISLKNETITKVSIKGESTNDITKSFVKKVNDELQNLVVGKKITEIKIPKQIAGASLTTAAFAKAVNEIVAENYK
jgi:hypothetical protein